MTSNRYRHPVLLVALALVAISTALFAPALAVADPIVLRNFGLIEGSASAGADGASFSKTKQFPVPGAGSLADSRSDQDGSLAASTAASVNVQLASGRYSSSGGWVGAASEGAGVIARSETLFGFSLSQPHVFTSSVELFIDNDVCDTCFSSGDGGIGVGVSLFNAASKVFIDSVDPFLERSGVFAFHHKGGLDPGSYLLDAATSTIFSSDPGITSHAIIRFDVTLDLVPAPTPEPATLILSATALLGLAALRCRWTPQE